jgi:hypothetical protein
LLILRSRPGDQYRNHLDFLPGAENQRRATGLVYLYEGYEGKTGLKVKGRKGDAVVFVNIGADRRTTRWRNMSACP